MIEEVVEVTDELMAAVELLLPQLSPSPAAPARRLEMEDIIASPRNALFIARDPDQNDEIVGMATLAMYRTPTGLHAWIEDVVVDEGARGKGFGAALTQACIQAAASAGAHGVNLTSRPARQAANRLYQRMGFVRRETNVYYYPLTLTPDAECRNSGICWKQPSGSSKIVAGASCYIIFGFSSMINNSSWLEVSLTVDGEMAEAVAEVLARFIPNGVAIESTAIYADPEDEGYPIGPLRVCGYLPVDDRLEETRHKVEEALWYLGRISPLPAPQFRTVQEQDWAEAWKQHYHPIAIGQRLIIVPAWLESPDPARIPIRMDPGMAFGTGTHPTTQLCLELAETVLTGQDQTPATLRAR